MSIVYKKFQKGGFGPLPKLDSIPPAPMPKSPTPWGGRNLDPGFRVGVPNTNDIKYGPGPRPGGPSFRLPTPQTAPPMDLGTSVPPPTNEKTSPWQVGTKLPGDRKFGPTSPKVPQGWKPVQSRPAGIIKYQDGGIKNPNAINTTSPETRNAIFKAKDESFANPESSEDRYYKNFKPATGKAEFDPLTQLGVGALATQGVKFATQGANAIKNKMASNAAKKAAEQEYKIAIAKTRVHNAEQLSRGNMAPGQAWRTMSSVAEHYKPFYKKGGILYKKGQAGGTVPASGIKPPKYKQPTLDGNQYVSPDGNIRQDYVGVDPNDPSRFITKGSNYNEASRIGTSGYTGDIYNVSRNQYDDYMKAFNNLENPNAMSDYSSRYADSNVDFEDQYLFDQSAEAFKDPSVAAFDFVRGNYTHPKNGTPVINESERDFTGYGSFYRQMEPLQDTPVMANPEAAPSIPEPKIEAPVNPTTQIVAPRTYSPSGIPGTGKMPKKGTSTRHLDKMRRKRKRQKGGLLY